MGKDTASAAGTQDHAEPGHVDTARFAP
jgi:hypothetical protein